MLVLPNRASTFPSSDFFDGAYCETVWLFSTKAIYTMTCISESEYLPFEIITFYDNVLKDFYYLLYRICNYVPVFHPEGIRTPCIRKSIILIFVEHQAIILSVISQCSYS